ncbi:hypothetical protein AMJ50_01140 [Parcubacteria bacterium DG_74_3]|nr:MAG: hypothetical protein AMJ50_01140 [Parcubacteria bacterium DG_74_3]
MASNQENLKKTNESNPSSPKTPSPKPDTSIFRGKTHLTREEMRERLRKATPFIPGPGRKMYSREERVKMEKELFGPKYGQYIERKEYGKVLKDLEKAKWRAPTETERFAIERKIRYLKDLSPGQ